MEIAEEEEDEQRASKRQSLLDDNNNRPPTASDRPTTAEPVTLNSDLASSPENSKFSAATTSEVPQFVGADGRPMSPESAGEADSPFEAFTQAAYPFSKPKVKLGPRPSWDVSGRPQTAGNFRPVSAIPAGFKLFAKGNKKNKSKDSDSISSPQDEVASINFEPAANTAPERSSSRPATSTGLQADAAAPPVTAAKKATISPEKARLMKAMKLRKEKKKMSMQPSSAAVSSLTETDILDDEEGGEVPAQDVIADPEPVSNGEGVTSSEKDSEQLKGLSLNNDDSGVVLDASIVSVQTDQTPDLTPSDSHPASPVVAFSEAEQSTKASSISESTDETIPAKGEEPIVDAVRNDVHTPTDAEITKDINAADAERSVSHGASEKQTEDAVREETTKVDEATRERTQDDAASSAELSTSAEVANSESAASRHSQSGDDSLENIALPISKFSPDALASAESAVAPKAPAESEKVSPESSSTGMSKSAEISASPTTVKLKVSAQDLLAAAKAASQPTVVSPAPVMEESAVVAVPEDPIVDEKSKEDDSDTDTIPAQATQQNNGKEDEEQGHKPHVEPIQTDLPKYRDQPSRMETQASEDKEVADETCGSTVEDAKPVAVSQTPVTPSFSASPASPASPARGPDGGHMVRTVSNPVRGNLIVPTDVSQSSARSMSSGAAYLHQITQQQQSGNLAKKSNIGSSISQRIKALEKLSANTGEVAAPPAARERPSSTFFSVKKREPSRSPSVMDRAGSFRHQTPPSPKDTSKEPSPESTRRERIERSGSVSSRLSMFESPPGSRHFGGPSVSQIGGRPESVSVTAKIIRDPNQGTQTSFEPPRDPSEYNPLELKQSPLLVDHQPARSDRDTVAAVPSPEVDRGLDAQDSKSHQSRQSSLSLVKGFMKERRKSTTSPDLGSNVSQLFYQSEQLHQQSATFSPSLSFGSPRSSFSRDRESIVSPIDSGFTDDAKSINGDKKLSRAGRFMRRLSNLSGSRGKVSPSAMSAPATKEHAQVAPQAPAQPRPSTTGTPTIVSFMGDVNVQFPDNLLWKRRNMCLDSQGYLILSALAAQNGRPAQGTKRYHLNEFRTPYIPDVEVQELPNSVVLDFIEGSGIQVACEDRAGQMRILESKSYRIR